jgi:hypothetical protein
MGTKGEGQRKGRLLRPILTGLAATAVVLTGLIAYSVWRDSPARSLDDEGIQVQVVNAEVQDGLLVVVIRFVGRDDLGDSVMGIGRPQLRAPGGLSLPALEARSDRTDRRMWTITFPAPTDSSRLSIEIVGVDFIDWQAFGRALQEGRPVSSEAKHIAARAVISLPSLASEAPRILSVAASDDFGSGRVHINGVTVYGGSVVISGYIEGFTPTQSQALLLGSPPQLVDSLGRPLPFLGGQSGLGADYSGFEFRFGAVQGPVTLRLQLELVESRVLPEGSRLAIESLRPFVGATARLEFVVE